MRSLQSQPLFFGPQERPLFGWLHQPAKPSALGLVICNPFGYEAVCAHRSIRQFAAAAAAAGVATLRFDYDGTGDSAGSDMDPHRLPGWINSIHQAADLLRAQTGVTRICLLGIRLGATLAALAGTQRDDVEGLIAIAPVVNARLYLRELRALALAGGKAEPPAWAKVIPELQETAGFALTAQTRDDLTGVDLLRTPPPARQALVIDRNDLPGNTAWVEHLRHGGCTVDHEQLAGYREMMLDSHEAQVPDAMLASIVRWLGERNVDSVQRGSPEAPGLAQAIFTTDADAVVRETAGFLDDDRTLFGIVTEPAERASQPLPLVLLLNSGAVHHIGPNRMHVAIARQWAASGAIVLRMDISGLGDSPAHQGAPENHVYTQHASKDVATAIVAMRARYQISTCHAVGLCSGAYHGYKAAIAGVGLDGVIAINPLTFAWREGMSVAYPEHRIAADVLRYRTNVLQATAWKKLLTGKVNIPELLQVVVRGAWSFTANFLRNCARFIRIPLRNDIGTELRQLRRQNTNVLFVFAAGEPGLDLLRGGGGSVVTRLEGSGALHIEIVAGADHTFTPHWSRQRLIDVLSSYLRLSNPIRPQTRPVPGPPVGGEWDQSHALVAGKQANYRSRK